MPLLAQNNPSRHKEIMRQNRGRPADADPDTGAVCLAVLCRDGFIGVDAGETEDRVVARSGPLTGDLLRGPVRWTGGDLEDGAVSLRFTLRKARLDSCWFE